VFDTPATIGTEPVKTQAVDSGIDLDGQSSSQGRPLSRIDFALEDRILDTLAEIKTSSGDAAQPAPSSRRLSIHIISHEHEHGRTSFPDKTGIAVEVAPQVAGQ
jgi:hypothetical protein